VSVSGSDYVAGIHKATNLFRSPRETAPKERARDFFTPGDRQNSEGKWLYLSIDHIRVILMRRKAAASAASIA